MSATNQVTSAPTPDALKAAGDIIKVSTGLATGALVFGVGLLPNAASYSPLTRVLLVLSWALLLVSIIAGILSQAAIPVLLADEDYDIENKYYTWPGRIHQVSFGFAVAILAAALISIMYSEPSHLSVSTAADAVARAEAAVGGQLAVQEVTKIELINGPSGSASDGTWHIQLEVTPKTGAKSPPTPTAAPGFLDVFITAHKGMISTLP